MQNGRVGGTGLGRGWKQWLSLAHTVPGCVPGCGVQASCAGTVLAALFPQELCSAVRSRGNSACGKHKVCRLWIQSCFKGTCRCWQALEIGSQHADV